MRWPRLALSSGRLIAAVSAVVLLALVGGVVAHDSLGRQYSSTTSLLVLPSSRAAAVGGGAAAQENPYRTISQGDAAVAQALVKAAGSADFRSQVSLPAGVSFTLSLDTVDGVTARGGFLTLSVQATSADALATGREGLIAGVRKTWADIQIAAGASRSSLIDLQNLGTSSSTVASSAALRATGAIVLLAAFAIFLLIVAYRRQGPAPAHRKEDSVVKTNDAVEPALSFQRS